MTFNRSTLSLEQKHDYLLGIYEKIRWHCKNFEIIYQYLLAGDYTSELIEEIYQTTETLSQHGHENILKQQTTKTRSLIQVIHDREAIEKEDVEKILSAIDSI